MSRPCFEQLYEAWSQASLAFIRSMIYQESDADDCFQQCWLSIHKALPKYEARGQERAWVFRVARNSVYDFLRQRRQWNQWMEKSRDIDDLERSAGTAEAFEVISAEELREHIQQAVHKLSPKLREVFLLRTQQDLSFQEIAEVLQEPRNRLLARMHLAHKEIHQAIAKFNQVSP
ncbi:MAG: RNA polymerase sigma factor [Planctomycetes bacterium]|nr:RNA polymerase sigma factor [Planctomycetota bacterium]